MKSLFFFSFVVVVLFLLGTISFIVATSSSSYPNPRSFYGNGYLLSLRPCADDDSSSEKTQLWNFQNVEIPQNGKEKEEKLPKTKITSTLRLYQYSDINCVEIWAGMQFPPPIKSGSVPTLWNCKDANAYSSPNYWFIYNDTTKTIQQQYQPTKCFGFSKDEKYEMIRILDCSNETEKENTKLELIPTKFDKNVFQLKTRNNFCVGVEKPAEKYVTLESDEWRVTFGTDGIEPHNFTYLINLQIYQGPNLGWSANLADSSRKQTLSHFSTSSITTLDDDDDGDENNNTISWQHATGGYFSKISSNHIIIEDVKIGDIALERWEIQIIQQHSGGGGSTLEWKIARTYLKDIREKMSRFATFVILNNFMTIGYNNISFQGQIPSTLDSSFQRNFTHDERDGTTTGTGAAFYTIIGKQPKGEKWVYAFSSKSNHWMTFSPADACMSWYKNTESFGDNNDYGRDVVYAAQYPDPNNYPLGESAFGLLASSRKMNSQKTDLIPKFIRKGLRVSTTFGLKMKYGSHSACESGHKLVFSTRNPTRDSRLRSLTRNFFMWSGNIIGNSPRSVTCTFSFAQYSYMISLFTPERNPQNPVRRIFSSSFSNNKNNKNNQNSYQLVSQPDLFEAFRYQLALWMNTAEGINKTTGLVNSQYDNIGWISYPAMYQQQTSFFIAVYNYALSSGDKDFIVENWDTNIMLALNFLLIDMGLESNKVCNALGLATGEPHATQSSNWMDIIAFGYEDVIINGEAMQVLSGFTDLAAWIGDNVTSKKLKKLHGEAVLEFNRKFWREDFGLYVDWIGKNGSVNQYAYIWNNHLALDMTSGVVGENSTRISKMLSTIDQLYVKFRSELNLTEKELFCTPTNFIQVPKEHQNDWIQDLGTYEDGCCFMLMSAWEIMMRFRNNETSKALELFDNIMEWYENRGRLWGQHITPATHVPKPLDEWRFSGGDVLTDTAVLPYSLLRASLKLRPTLTEGILIDGEPGQLLEGFSWSFYYKGERKTATVVNGLTVITDYHHSHSHSHSGGESENNNDSDNNNKHFFSSLKNKNKH